MMPPRFLPVVRVRLLEELENRLGEIVAPRDDALHVVFLVLHRTQEHRILQVDHRRHAEPLRTEQQSLALGGARDQIVGRPEILADELGLVFVERALEVGGQEAVLHVHAGRQAQLGHPPEDQRLIGGLLGILAEDDDPARVERPIHIVVAAMHVQRVLGQRPRADLEHHRRALARRVVVLLDAIDDALARREVDDAPAADRVGDGAALRRVLPLGLDRQGIAPEDVQPALGERLLVELSTLRRRRDRIEHTGIRDTGLRVVGNELVSIGRDADSGIPRPVAHGTVSADPRDTKAPTRGAGECERRIGRR
jgi:hypothetical protein